MGTRRRTFTAIATLVAAVLALGAADEQRSAALPAFATAPAALPSNHVVAPGDTIAGIAQRYGLAIDDVLAANQLGDPRTLQPGDVVVLQPGHEDPLGAILDDAARRFDLDPALVRAVAWVESRWDPDAHSERGAVGLMQVLPETAAAMGAQLGEDLVLADPRDNAIAGAAYLRQLRDELGDVEHALVAYHQGPVALRRDGTYGSSSAYLFEVGQARAEFAENGRAG